jgi:hypothetical protein
MLTELNTPLIHGDLVRVTIPAPAVGDPISWTPPANHRGLITSLHTNLIRAVSADDVYVYAIVTSGGSIHMASASKFKHVPNTTTQYFFATDFGEPFTDPDSGDHFCQLAHPTIILPTETLYITAAALGVNDQFGDCYMTIMYWQDPS